MNGPDSRRIDPASLPRIAVNDELGSLNTALKGSPTVGVGGVAVISFHSLEDRMVKTAFRDVRDTKC